MVRFTAPPPWFNVTDFGEMSKFDIEGVPLPDPPPLDDPPPPPPPQEKNDIEKKAKDKTNKNFLITLPSFCNKSKKIHISYEKRGLYFSLDTFVKGCLQEISVCVWYKNSYLTIPVKSILICGLPNEFLCVFKNGTCNLSGRCRDHAR
jgi:hypothetical protein